MAEFAYDGRDLEAMSFAKNYHAWILDLFRPFLGTHVAEVGAGSGGFSELLLREQIGSLVTVEPSRSMIDILKKETSDDKRITYVNDFFANVYKTYREHFDSVVYVNVLEHVEDDEKEISFVYESLRPGGHVCIFVPALPWLYSKHDASIGHYRRYTKRELVECVSAAGFEIVKARYFDIAGVLPWLILFRLMKRSPGKGAVGLYDALVVPIMCRVEQFLRLPLGKNVYVIGRKPHAGT